MTVGGRVAVVGAGTMGAGLAQVCAAAGREVVLYSRTRPTLDRATAAIDESLRRIARRDGSVDPAAVRARIATTTDLDDVAGAAVAIESVAEELPAKQKVLCELDARCPDLALVATNTSCLSVGAIAAASSRPDRVVGMHFFAPVPVMPLCEIVPGPGTPAATVATARAFAAEIGKQPVVLDRDTPGFVSTRLLAVLIAEAVRVVESGLCSAADVDLVCRLAFGHPMGPLAVADLSGLDVVRDVLANLAQATGEPMFAPPRLLDELVAGGHGGVKTGRGFHRYPAQERPS